MAAYRWALELERAIELKTDPQEIQEYSQRLLIVAAACRGTYDIADRHLPAILCTAADLRIFMHCAFMIYHNTPTKQAHMSADIQHALSRDYRLRHRVQDSIAEQITQGNDGLDEAIQCIWIGFARSGLSSWIPVHASSTSWWLSRTIDNAIVHCNIFDGQFLVNGKPLGRLPESYTNHETYRRIFGNVRTCPIS